MINDFLAGLADLGALPFDVISLGMGSIKYPFKKVFTDSENPFAEGVANSWTGQIAQGVRNFSTKLFDSDPESGWRRAGSDIGGLGLDLFTGGSGRMIRRGISHIGNHATRKAGKRLIKRALMDTAVTNTAVNLGMSALSGEGFSPTESVLAGAAVLGAPQMISRLKGMRRARAKARMLEQQFAPNDAQQHAANMKRYDLVDARGAAVDEARREGFDVGDEFRVSPTDWVKKDAIVNKADEALAAFKNEDEALNHFNQITSELQQRLQAPITIMNTFRDDRKGKIAAALGEKIETARDKLNSATFDDLMELMNKHPEIFPETGYLDEFGQPISNAKLVLKYNELKQGLTAEQLARNKQFLDLLQEDRLANLDAGVISAKEFANEGQKARQVGYIPKSDMDIRVTNTEGLLGVTPNATSIKAATKAGEGVGRQTNTFETVYKVLYNHAIKRKFNADVIKLAKSIKARLPALYEDVKSKLALARNQVNTSTGWDKYLAEMNIKYYQNRLKELDKFEFGYQPKRFKNSNDIIFPDDRDIVSFMKDGNQEFFTVPKNYMKSLFSYGDNNTNQIIQGIQNAHNFMLPFRTGKWNVLNFGFVKAAYGLWEGMPAIMAEAKKRGVNISPWKIMFEQLKQAKNILSNEYHQWLINNIKRKGRYLGYDTSDIAELEKKMTDSMFSVFTSPYDNFAELSKIGATHMFDFINPDTATKMEKLASMAKDTWHWIDKSAPVEILRMLNTAAAESMSAATTKLAKELFPDNAERIQALINISKKTSDTRRFGAATSKTGKTINTLSKVMPYGKSTVQGLAGKLDYFNLGENMSMLNNLVHGSRGIDKLMNLATVLAGKTQGEVFDTLWKLVVVPTAICYFWNNMTPDQAEDYHELTNLARSKNRMLVNFGGRGIHAYFPVDQEWSVLSNMTEAMLDAAFGMSDQDPNNPDWSYQDQFLKAAGRALGIEFPVPVNMLTGAVGFEGKVNAETLLGGEDSVIEPIKGSGLEGRISYELGEVLGTMGNLISSGVTNRPFHADMIGQIPLVTDSWAQTHKNSTSEFVDSVFKKDPINFPCKDLMNKRKYLEARLRHFKQTGLTMDGRPYNMPKQKVVETINHDIQKVNGEMYRILKGDQ